MNKIVFGLLSLIIVLGLVACTPAPQEDVQVLETVTEETESAVVQSGMTYQVVLENIEFMPADLEISVGDTVEWINKDYSSYTEETDDEQDRDALGREEGISHTVTFESIDVDRQLPPGATTTYTFTEAGEFSYVCQFHPSMQGRIIVH
ncbi:hypothetical protein COV17_01235 [Candidatus Woesearchaeota archaeon CG10_big_fil_rev_8_21_14_0_10_36_11]|nr:MAG: hypothetical protein COV17_01235 [Candidatus Woesearchaeota archaeon CG10_big_fil_rev_8_21_14_0_10_36_11]